jgi:hypothetical protein
LYHLSLVAPTPDAGREAACGFADRKHDPPALGRFCLLVYDSAKAVLDERGERAPFRRRLALGAAQQIFKKPWFACGICTDETYICQ